MLRVKSGEVRLLGELYERYKKWLYNFFVQMNSDRDLSEDLVQNVFMRIMKYKHTYSEESKFTTWIFQIARNAQNDHFRKNAKSTNHLDIEKVSYSMESDFNHDSDQDRKDEKQLLRVAMQRLSEEKREVLVLSKLKEMKYREVGEVLKCSEEAARTKAHRALKELKSIYLELQGV